MQQFHATVYQGWIPKKTEKLHINAQVTYGMFHCITTAHP